MPRPAPQTPGSAKLARQLGGLRRRALAVGLAGAAIAALAADLWYEAAAFWLFRLTGVRIWFPIFSLVAFAVLAAAVARRTRSAALAGLLDARHGLKERLRAAEDYRRLARVPPEVREAQARETLRAVDFGRLRAGLRLRPFGQLAALAAGGLVVGGLMYRHPESFNPRSVVLRQGRALFVKVRDLGGGAGPGERPGAPRGGDAGDGAPPGHPTVVAVPEDGAPAQPPPGAKTEQAPGEHAPPGARPDDPSRPPRERERRPETASRRDEAGRHRGEGRPRLGSDGSRGAQGRPVSLEETTAVSGPVARPEPGLAAAAADLRGLRADAALPPVPFVRLLGLEGSAASLFDPETLTVVLEAYPPKYREHLEAYFRALQSLREERHGS